MAIFQEFLNTTRGTNFVKTALNYTDAQVAQLRNLLSNEDNPNDNVTTWKDFFRQFDGAVRLVTKVRSAAVRHGSCVIKVNNLTLANRRLCKLSLANKDEPTGLCCIVACLCVVLYIAALVDRSSIMMH